MILIGKTRRFSRHFLQDVFLAQMNYKDDEDGSRCWPSSNKNKQNEQQKMMNKLRKYAHAKKYPLQYELYRKIG